MPDKLSYNARLKNQHHEVEATNIIVVLFEEGDAHIAYAPALDLSGYGYSDDEAKASFEIVLKNFLDITTKKGTLVSELKRLGWNLKGNTLKLVKSPSFDELLDTNQSLSRLVEEGVPLRPMRKPVKLFANA
ncbi:MAG TPA: hypothetical protein VFH95_11280 [Candidatus Kapabacteria bacterium]|nr:hypothetical protein [Candidatus Kapabacteria bacterium]